VDRVIQQAIAQVLTPIFDSGFSDLSFGFRPGRSAHAALRQVQGYVKAGYRIAVDLDLAKFFDHVDHDILTTRLSGRRDAKRRGNPTAGPLLGAPLEPMVGRRHGISTSR
jgi:RNA-directed DNA polymerase